MECRASMSSGPCIRTWMSLRRAGLQFDPESPEDPHLRAYRSGFWGTLSIAPRPEGLHRVLLRARLEDGTAVTVPLLSLTATPPLPVPMPAPSQRAAGPLVAICMATYHPPMDLFRRQIQSIRAQTHAELGLRHQRRLLGPRAVCGDRARARRRPAICRLPVPAAARLLPEFRARPRHGPVRGGIRRALRPG